jgi:putative spermidine/putrescine transport system ATP-binding protein
LTHDQEEALTMSDRLAVFNRGRIEQVGAPADVYERPRTAFVAGFVGVSNILDRDGRRFSIRPEKIQLLAPHDAPGGGLHVEGGVVRDVVYAGMATRYVVELDDGGVLNVVRQNLDTSSTEALEAKGRSVRLAWSRDHEFAIDRQHEREETR